LPELPSPAVEPVFFRRLSISALVFTLLCFGKTPIPYFQETAALVLWEDVTPYFGETNPVLTGDDPRTLRRRIPYLRETIPVLWGDESRTYGRRIVS
jgi:hypothetical protein